MKIGLIGCGRWGRLILRDLVSLGADVSVVVPSQASRATALAKGAASAFATLDALPDMDGYVIAVPTVSHAETIDALLPRGRPIFVEKPLTCDAASAARIARAAPDRVFCMDKWRYHGGVLELADLARSGELGRILAIHTWRLDFGNPHADVDASWILLPHDLSIVQEVVGTVPAVTSASGYRSGASDASLVTVLGGGRHGPLVTCEISSLHPVKRRSMVVVGTTGSAQYGDSYDTSVRLCRPGAEPQDLPIETGMPLLAELGAFLDHLAGGAAPKSSAQEAALVVARVAEARRLAGF
ncbi:Gfo/Idh/MocA family oxidoreductase [Aquibium carbonis]|uniref:Gfo/Idh/MocA family oxidoreductase n=1 Tax=Aquibium carbonis TaxID=2495581 RepID=A0A429YF97_9HYPH|nr:Gfo/Idh/MocA family oxidoreductase [Aquibium carbonis]RST80096.1 Gfo/Idh/MocA family oxidoreductase [Aquibium carbonis]